MTDYYFVIDELEYPQTSEQTETATAESVVPETYNNLPLLDASQTTLSTSAVDLINNDNTSLNNFPQTLNFVNVASNNHITPINIQQSQINRRNCETIAFKIFNIFELTEKPNNNLREVKIWQQYRWSCFLCSFFYDYYKLLTNHLRDAHQVICQDDIRYQCSDCGRVFDEYSKFLNHVRQHHPHLNSSCDICGRSYEQYEMLAMHRETAHSDQANLRPKVYNCNQCELTFSTKEQVDAHCINHIWLCSVCNQEFDKKNEYFQHKIAHAIERKNSTKQNNVIYYQCDYCTQKFLDRSEFWSHSNNQHSSELPYKCQKCDARFAKKTETDAHALLHETIRCKYCKQVFTNPSEYQPHLKTHMFKKTWETASESRKYSCKKCGKTFHTGLSQVKHTKFSCLRHSLAFRMPTKMK